MIAVEKAVFTAFLMRSTPSPFPLEETFRRSVRPLMPANPTTLLYVGSDLFGWAFFYFMRAVRARDHVLAAPVFRGKFFRFSHFPGDFLPPYRPNTT